MKRAITSLSKLILAALIVLASLPVSATEVVCVIGPKHLTVPLAKCGMPCCAGGEMRKQNCAAAARTGDVPPCCRKHLEARIGKKADPCYGSGGNCRCETRTKCATRATSVLTKTVAALVFRQIAVFAAPTVFGQHQAARHWSPIYESDSGPPPRPKLRPAAPRAPPALTNV